MRQQLLYTRQKVLESKFISAFHVLFDLLGIQGGIIILCATHPIAFPIFSRYNSLPLIGIKPLACSLAKTAPRVTADDKQHFCYFFN